MPTPQPDDDAWLDRTLRERHSDDYIDDAGFTARVVSALPRPSHRRAWVFGSATAMGCAITVSFGLPAFTGSITRVDLSFATQLIADPLLPSYVVISVSLLLAAGSTWWALARKN